MNRCSTLVLLSTMVPFPAAHADTLAFNFAYQPATSGAELAAGYKKHLEWHEAVGDPILWYAWFVAEGERLGMLVDGAYDVTGAEFDARPDPAGDAADATRYFAPNAVFRYRRIYRLRPELGTSTFLEDRDPSPLMQVIYYELLPGRQAEFERAARAVAAAGGESDIAFTKYEAATGAPLPTYLMYLPMQGFAGLDTPGTSLESLARSLMTPADAAAVLTDIASSTRSTIAEVWQYRADLSLIPD